MRRHIFISSLLIILVITSCYPSPADIEGLYVREYKPGYGKLVLSSDSSFIYNLNLELVGRDKFYGTWGLCKNNLTLNVISPVIKEYRNIKDTITEIFDPQLKFVKFEIFEDDSIPLLSAQININNGAVIIDADTKGIILFKEKINIKKISVSTPGSQEFNYKVKKQKSNYFKCYIYNTEWIPYLYRDFPYYWKISGNKLYKRGDKSVPYNKL